MTSRTVSITFRINFPLILFLVLAFHTLLVFQELRGLTSLSLKNNRRGLKVVALRDDSIFENDDLKLRRVGSKTSKLQTDSNYLGGRRHAPVKNDRITDAKKPALNLSDLSVATNPKVARMARPGSIPEVTVNKAPAINAISLKGKEIAQFLKSPNSVTPGNPGSSPSAAALSGDPRVDQISATDILVNLEVPEGVEPDELNKYELMFYGFQRRTAINYVNSFYKNLDKFQRANPHIKFPVTDSRQVMTGRLTYDEKGNIKQIKMIRWSNEDKLQGFFEDVLKDMDVLHNPPQALWKKHGEFSIFFSFVVNG